MSEKVQKLCDFGVFDSVLRLGRARFHSVAPWLDHRQFLPGENDAENRKTRTEKALLCLGNHHKPRSFSLL